MSDLHSALRTTIDGTATRDGFELKRACLQHGKDQFSYSLHVRPTQFSTAGMQRTDFLRLLGLTRQGCVFHSGEAYCGAATPTTDLEKLAEALVSGFANFEAAERHLQACGLVLEQPEGWGYFYGRPPGASRRHAHHCRGDGHTAPKVESLKRSEDEFFLYSLSWIDGSGDKGWTVHYQPKHSPMSAEFVRALSFIGDFHRSTQCPEFDFDPCWWRFVPFASSGGPFDTNAENAHRCFDAHASNFAPGLRSLLEAHAVVGTAGMRLLPAHANVMAKPLAPTLTRSTSRVGGSELGMTPAAANESTGFVYDVAFSFAGSERAAAEAIATRVRDAGFSVFYDNFYPEQLWGEDLAATFDRIYRRESRYCVMFVSREYKDRLWTTHERRSATARALAERGAAYILPLYVEPVDIDGLPPTLGHVSLAEKSTDEVAELLTRKLRTGKT